MNDNGINYRQVEQFLKNKYPGHMVYEAMFTQIIALHEMFDFIYKKNQQLFCDMNRDCEAFHYLGSLVVKLQTEGAASVLEKKAM